MRASAACSWLLALAEASGATGTAPAPKGAPPFTYSLDQAEPCPEGSQDYVMADAGGGGPLELEGSPAVEAVLAAASARLRGTSRSLRSPSAGYLVAQGGRVLRSEFVGTAKVGGTSPPTRRSGLLIASITKTFTAAMLYKLRDEGRLPAQGADAPLEALLPNFAIRPAPRGLAGARGGSGITLRSMAMQASGLPRETPECRGCKSPPSTDEMLARIAGLQALSPPWQTTHYSNLGFALLGRALEVAANKTWETYVAEDLLAPLGMASTGNPPWPDMAARERMAEGVDPDSQQVIGLPNASSWDAPCGGMYSTPSDMAIWMSFLMDSGSEEQRRRWAEVLSPATRAEMRNTGVLQGDGVSAVGGGGFETAYFASRRWGANKLGCVDGYRSAISMVPSLGLAVFGVATSTCDLFGDGDAVSFRLVSELVPAVESALEARALLRAPLPPLAHEMPGRYCATEIRIEDVAPEGVPAVGRALVARGPPGEYPFLLQYLGRVNETALQFRKVMGPEKWLPADWKGCSSPEAPAENLCPVSCFRKMTRGSGDLVVVTRDAGGRFTYGGCRQQPTASNSSAAVLAGEGVAGSFVV